MKSSVSYRTASTGIFFYVFGLLLANPSLPLIEAPGTTFDKGLLAVEGLLIPAYLIAAIGLRREKVWGKSVAVATAAVDLAVLATKCTRKPGIGILLFARSWLPRPLGLLPISAVAFMAVAAVTVLLVVPGIRAAPVVGLSEAERLLSIQRGRRWFWGTIGLGCALPLAAGVVQRVGRHAQISEVHKVLVFGPGIVLLLVREFWPFLLLAVVVQAIMSAPLREHGLSVGARKAIVCAGLGAVSILSPGLWFIVFERVAVPVAGLSIEAIETALLFRFPGAVGEPLVLSGVIVMGAVWVIERLFGLGLVAGSTQPQPSA